MRGAPRADAACTPDGSNIRQARVPRRLRVTGGAALREARRRPRYCFKVGSPAITVSCVGARLNGSQVCVVSSIIVAMTL